MNPFWSIWLTGLGVLVVMMLMVWVASVVRRDAGLVDLFWGTGFVLVTWTYFLLCEDGAPARKWLTAALVTLWGARLSLHLAWRNLGKPEDYRYRAMRERRGKSFAWVSLFTVFLLQATLISIISLPLLQAEFAATPAELGALDGAAVLLFAVGLFFEAVGDWQLARHRADPARRGQVLSCGLWRYTRHPNYFGDAVVWWSFGLLALATGSVWPLIGPALMTFFLMRVSGVTLLEQKLRETRPAYADYVARTSSFIPWFPRS